MRRSLRQQARLDGTVEARRIATTLGAQVRSQRGRLRLTQADLGLRVGLTQSRISDVERGLGVGLPLEIWVALGIALGQPLAVSFSRPTRAEDSLVDAGHLEIQEYLLEIGRRNGRLGSFERPTRAYDPTHSIDVHHDDDRHDCAIIEEAWNRIGDLGAAARSSSRKVADAKARTTAGRVALCWVVRDSHANRAIVSRYPEVIAARFTGSSALWVEALERGAMPPREPGIVWFDPSRRRLKAMRLRPRS
ncbi:MAG TPA: helix-turn-helix domain-containing protein [Candidatus Limnocylindrales bacterium]|nr:helix-turn-helix domain-containing protein [Candidatus Limnocylindrales bacterium]